MRSWLCIVAVSEVIGLLTEGQAETVEDVYDLKEKWKSECYYGHATIELVVKSSEVDRGNLCCCD